MIAESCNVNPTVSNDKRKITEPAASNHRITEKRIFEREIQQKCFDETLYCT